MIADSAVQAAINHCLERAKDAGAAERASLHLWAKILAPLTEWERENGLLSDKINPAEYLMATIATAGTLMAQSARSVAGDDVKALHEIAKLVKAKFPEYFDLQLRSGAAGYVGRKDG